jgi:cytoskeletal protein RodZ
VLIVEETVADNVKDPVLVRRVVGSPKPKYHESAYQRPLIQRFTPFAWFILLMALLGLVVSLVLLVKGITSAQQRSLTLDERLAEIQQVNPTVFALTAVAQVPTYAATPTHTATTPALTATPRPQPTQTPVPTPTLNPNDAPWANQMIQQPDRTLLAPQAVVDQATADLSAYYAHLQNLSLDDFLRERYDLLSTYFTGQALADMREQEGRRTQYVMNRSGIVVIQIRSFSSDGNSALAGIALREWANDVYDVTSHKLLQQDVREPNSLLVMSIAYDRADGRWKFATLDPDSEVSK